MQIVKLIIVPGLLLLFTGLLNMSINSSPALGNLFSPYTGFWQNAEAVEENIPQSLTIPSLEGTVKVVYDDRLVPHIFAEKEEDAMFAQGYIVAQNRLWQMEFQTHMAAGRLAEVIGNRAIELDQKMRHWGLAYGAWKTNEHWKKNLKVYKLIEAYTAGVNEYINSLQPEDYPLEYKLLGYAPEEWSPYKSALLSKLMAFDLAKRENDLESTNSLAVFGREAFDFLYPEENPDESPVIPKGTPWDFVPKQLRSDSLPPVDTMNGFSFRAEPKPFEHLGSNNWAVAGKKTTSGSPILCNDPHLKLSLPSVWFELQITTPEMNAYGVCLVGSPGITIGFNDHIAWGVTNVGHDVSDWYTINWKDEKREEYLLNGTYVKPDIVVEEFKIKNAETIKDTVLYTHWGPVIYTAPEHPLHDLAFHWLAHEASDEMEAFYLLNRARNYDDFTKATAMLSCPAQNFAFIEREVGNIALNVQGKFPLKQVEQGRFIQDGTTTSNEWHGFIPNAHIPRSFNPERGFVASANQYSTDITYPYYYNGGFGDYRGRLINGRLEAMDGITVNDMMKLQTDVYGLRAEESLPLLLDRVDKSELRKEEVEMFKMLSDWDYNYEKDQLAPAFYNIWWDEFYKLTWDEIKILNDSLEMLYPEDWRTISLLKNNADNAFFDIQHTTPTETATEVANDAFKEACRIVADWEHKEGEKMTWAKYKHTTITHLARIGAFSRENIDVGGDKRSINAISELHGPSWRMIVEMKPDGIEAYGIYPAGQSGNPGSKHYDDFVDKWAKGEYYPLLFLEAPDEVNDRIIGRQQWN